MPEQVTAAALPSQGRLSALILRQETTLVAVILAVAIGASLRNPAFLDPANLTDIARAAVIYFIMGCGASLLMIGGGLDFSVGAVFTLGGIVCASLLSWELPWPIAVLAGVGAGAAAGFVNSVIIERLHVPPIIATLGTFFIIGGLCVEITGGQDIVPLPDAFQALGQGSLLGVPYIILYAVATGLLFSFLLEQTPFGVETRALGGNRKAAIANGLKVKRLDTILYVAAGATAGLAGVIYAARVGSGQVAAGGSSVTLTVVTATLIGGISLLGGLGTISGVATGALLLSAIDNALIVASVPPQYNSIIVGAILICAVAVDHLRRQRLYRVRR
ncbi:ABC transporter permease [Labrys wisconsinensis]|uniref:Autoinducer 2 import system permease protein LsrD n=1 Tax=Labrys wisconsinensis TaxID=425677 RepID=A0ABU0JLU6_9HYPH|nr:ABC transporter permease [Labrys wisconsinensis]MDQ0474092.1 ribose transport system permease protein [Labrys wisconsinensis]